MQMVDTKLSWALLPTSCWLNFQTSPTNVAVRIAHCGTFHLLPLTGVCVLVLVFSRRSVGWLAADGALRGEDAPADAARLVRRIGAHPARVAEGIALCRLVQHMCRAAPWGSRRGRTTIKPSQATHERRAEHQ